MKFARLLVVLLLLAQASCTDRSSSSDQLLEAIDCQRRNVTGSLALTLETERKDRENYSPVSSADIPIKMNQPGQGYHGPTIGSYVLMIETYQTDEEATTRAEEFDIHYAERIPNPTRTEVDGKSTVRCWGIADGKDVYLLTTHAAMFSALETRTNDLEKRLRAYLLK